MRTKTNPPAMAVARRAPETDLAKIHPDNAAELPRVQAAWIARRCRLPRTVAGVLAEIIFEGRRA